MKTYRVTFGRHCIAEIIAENDSIKVARAMDGWGDKIKVEDITITEE